MLRQEDQFIEKRRSLRALKRGIYLGTSLLGSFAIVSVVAFHLLTHTSTSSFEWLALSPLAAVLAFLSLALWRDRPSFHRVESLKFGLFSLLFLADFVYAFLLGPPLGLAPTSLIWAPLIWLLSASIYLPRQALMRSSLLVGLSLMVVLAAALWRTDHLWSVLGANLLLFYLVSAVMIGLLFLLSRLQHDYTSLARFAEEMRHTAHTDALTGVPNRRALERMLELEISAAEQEGKSFSLILFDIDYFKRVNDTYGHDVGDEVLKQIVIISRRQLRKTDRLGRWGGEEFMIVAAGVGGDEAYGLAERFRLAVENWHFHGVDFPITLSFGVASYGQGDSVESLLKRAFGALYGAKHQGRNRVIVETPVKLPL